MKNIIKKISEKIFEKNIILIIPIPMKVDKKSSKEKIKIGKYFSYIGR